MLFIYQDFKAAKALICVLTDNEYWFRFKFLSRCILN